MQRLLFLSLIACAATGALSIGASEASAQDKPYIAVGSAKIKKSVIAYPETKIAASTSQAQGVAKTIRETVDSDLAYMDMFKMMDRAAYIEPKTAGLAPNSFKFSDWTSIGVEFLIKTALSMEGSNVALEAYLYDVNGAKQLLSKRYVSSKNEAATIGHTLANDVVKALTGSEGIFLTKIAMICDRTKSKEVYMMDFDGTNVKQITKHKSITLAPAWSPDGTHLAYSLFTRRGDGSKNIDLFEYDFNTSKLRLLSNKKGMNSGASYSPDGKKIAATMSFLGNPELFSIDRETLQATRLSKTFGQEVDPTWSPDGKKMAFVSSRSGMPMVFSMNVDGSNVQRLTYAGRYNATPDWSTRGDKIVFSGWVDGKFDVFTMNSDGSKIERLTKNQGSNEDPNFSPDGNFIVFSSNRTGQKNIYVMNLDGSYVRRLTYGLGNCVSPKWSPAPKK